MKLHRRRQASLRPCRAAALAATLLVALAPAASHEPTTGHVDTPEAAAEGDHTVWGTLTDFYYVRQMPSPGAPRGMGNAELRFGDTVLALVDTEVELEGFMVPFEADAEQATFLLVKQPVVGCGTCEKQGPASLVRVAAAGAVPRTEERIAVRGRLGLLHGDPMGVMYVLRDAVLVER